MYYIGSITLYIQKKKEVFRLRRFKEEKEDINIWWRRNFMVESRRAYEVVAPLLWS
jgi:hypothetical protein